MPHKAKPVAPANGERVGTKKFDMRWRDASGNIWASKHEYDVYAVLESAGTSPRKCSAERDSLAYRTNVRGGRCFSCQSKAVGQEHKYTPDIHTTTAYAGVIAAGSYVEAKGYLRAADRRVLRGVMAAHPDLSLCLVLQRYHAKTVEWAKKFLRIPVLVLDKTKGLIEAK